MSSQPGAVVVSRTLAAGPAEVWRALTDPAQVAGWFGTLTPGLRPGVPARLDFEDGDFFSLEDVRLDPPHTIGYCWRFLGIGPRSAVTWTLTPLDAGCRVTVTDHQPRRPPDVAAELRKGWLDFTRRLKGFLATGQSSRYRWRREVDGVIELAAEPEAAWGALLAALTGQPWRPPARPEFGDGVRLPVGDGLEPAAFEGRDVEASPPHALAFSWHTPVWRGPTRCRLQLWPVPGETVLSFSHSGWKAVGPNPEEQRGQRRRFAGYWVRTLQRVEQSLR